jgi:hypothetical protein
MFMKMANITELRKRLSELLAEVERGEEIEVLDTRDPHRGHGSSPRLGGGHGRQEDLGLPARQRDLVTPAGRGAEALVFDLRHRPASPAQESEHDHS